MKRRYPFSLFMIGFITNIIFHYFYLFIPAIIFLIVGIFNKTVLHIGLVILVIDIIMSVIEQLRIRAALMKDSEDDYLREFQNALSMDGNWIKNVGKVFDKKETEGKND